MSSGAITVELAAYVAADLFNERSHLLLFLLKSIGVNLSHNAHTFAGKSDVALISRRKIAPQKTTNCILGIHNFCRRVTVWARNR